MWVLLEAAKGVELERQILVTDSGYELLSDMDFDDELVG